MSSRLGHGKKMSVGLAATTVMLMMSGGTAHAATGSGSIGAIAYEIPSERVTLSGGQVQCATFHRLNAQGQDDPTIHSLPMTSGNFGLITKTGGGTATFTINNDWYAGPSGTFTSNTCATAGSVEGTLSVSYVGWSCASDTSADYTRSSTTTYSLVGTVVCDNTSTGTVETTAITLTFSGTQVLCGGTGQPTCDHVDAGTNIQGTYSWST